MELSIVFSYKPNWSPYISINNVAVVVVINGTISCLRERVVHLISNARFLYGVWCGVIFE